MARPIKWSKKAPQEYEGTLHADIEKFGPTAKPVAVIVKTGTHLDHYPWDWYLTSYGVMVAPDSPLPGLPGTTGHKRHHAGVCDTLRSGKDNVEVTLS